MHLRVKLLHPDATLPKYAHDGDAGFDVFAKEDVTIPVGERRAIYLGFSAEIPDGTVALVWDKGGIAAKQGITSLAGVIDAGYRGEWLVVLHNLGSEPFTFAKGMKVAQVLIQQVERPTIEVAQELSETARGAGKFGSTGQ
ncbi:MAG: dUTP diphosphatase [Patescibacteria group bacterium]|jgi:dUTP pyrophosphatase